MLLTLLACVDLPSGWEDAETISDFTQSECTAAMGDTGVVTEVTGQPFADGVSISAEHVWFRCEQPVEGWWRVADQGADVLLQPEDMNPKSVAKCDCAYDFTFVVPTAPPAEVTVYTRGDHQSGQDQPVRVGSTAVE